MDIVEIQKLLKKWDVDKEVVERIISNPKTNVEFELIDIKGNTYKFESLNHFYNFDCIFWHFYYANKLGFNTDTKLDTIKYIYSVTEK